MAEKVTTNEVPNPGTQWEKKEREKPQESSYLTNLLSYRKFSVIWDTYDYNFFGLRKAYV